MYTSTKVKVLNKLDALKCKRYLNVVHGLSTAIGLMQWSKKCSISVLWSVSMSKKKKKKLS